MEKMNTLPHETIHIMPRCVMHLYGHRKKVVPLLKPFIFMDLSNGIKFRNCTYWLINDTWNHFHVGLVTTTLATKNWSFQTMQKLACNETPDVRAYHHFHHIVCPLSSKSILDNLDGIMSGYLLTFKQAMS